MTPKMFLYVARNPHQTARQMAVDMAIIEKRVHLYIRQANKSKYAEQTGERIISGGNGYTLLSQSTPLEKLSATELRLVCASGTLLGAREMAYAAKIASRDAFVKLCSSRFPEINASLQEIFKPLHQPEQIELKKDSKQMKAIKKKTFAKAKKALRIKSIGESTRPSLKFPERLSFVKR